MIKANVLFLQYWQYLLFSVKFVPIKRLDVTLAFWHVRGAKGFLEGMFRKTQDLSVPSRKSKYHYINTSAQNSNFPKLLV